MSRPQFSSRFATLLAMAAFAVGVANVWRFPYMMGQNGGSAFLIIYLVFVIVLAVPVLTSEWGLGRGTGSGPIGAYKAAFGTRFGLPLGFFLVLVVFTALTYYNIVVGNVIYSAVFALWHGFDGQGIVEYQKGLANNRMQFMYAIGLTVVSLWIVQRGLRRGIEKANFIIMPLFGIIVLYMVGVALTLDGAIEELKQFMRPDFSQAGPGVWFAAMGQACFSVGISGCIGVLYGSYLREQETLVPSAAATGLIDTGAAVLASLFVVPAVLVFGLDLAAGPPLLFNTLPRLFEVMPGGRLLGGPFLAAWALVAILTIVAAFEATIGALHDHFSDKLSRRGWTLVVGVAMIVAMAPVAYNPQIIGTLDLVVGSGLFMLGSMMAVIAFGWGLGKAAVKAQVALGLGERAVSIVTFWIRWVVPVVLFAILAGGALSALGVV
ncbi:MAG TPA: sodium-dependent transporter [Xanthomonadales bacterium]|nr:sodium-dependent transporter [Xanthomonadales bacterium]